MERQCEGLMSDCVRECVCVYVRKTDIWTMHTDLQKLSSSQHVTDNILSGQSSGTENVISLLVLLLHVPSVGDTVTHSVCLTKSHEPRLPFHLPMAQKICLFFPQIHVTLGFIIGHSLFGSHLHGDIIFCP